MRRHRLRSLEVGIAPRAVLADLGRDASATRPPSTLTLFGRDAVASLPLAVLRRHALGREAVPPLPSRRLIFRISLNDHDPALPFERDKHTLQRGERFVIRRRGGHVGVVAWA